MHGPYFARVVAPYDNVLFSLTDEDVAEGERIADRFYQPAGTGVLVGFQRAAVFTVGQLLLPGESADVEIIGRDGPEHGSLPCQASSYNGDHTGCPVCDGSGRRRAREVVARRETVRRDGNGRLLSTLGSRFGERIFRGV